MSASKGEPLTEKSETTTVALVSASEAKNMALRSGLAHAINPAMESHEIRSPLRKLPDEYRMRLVLEMIHTWPWEGDDGSVELSATLSRLAKCRDRAVKRNGGRLSDEKRRRHNWPASDEQLVFSHASVVDGSLRAVTLEAR